MGLAKDANDPYYTIYDGNISEFKFYMSTCGLRVQNE